MVQTELDLKKKELFQKAARSVAAAAAELTGAGRSVWTAALLCAESRARVGHRLPSSLVRVVERRRDAAVEERLLHGPRVPALEDAGPEDWEPREADVGHELEARLNREFPPDILHFKLVPALDDDGTDAPKVSRPTFVITHRDELSGAFMSKKPRGAFAGLGFTVRSVLLIPGDNQPPLAFKFSA